MLLYKGLRLKPVILYKLEFAFLVDLDVLSYLIHPKTTQFIQKVAVG